MPFPDDGCTVVSDRFDLDDVVRPNVVFTSRRIAYDLWISSSLKGFFLGSVLPSDHEDVPVRHGLNVVVRNEGL
jgi:hypothetical protein